MLVQTKSCTVAARRELTREETGGGLFAAASAQPSPCSLPAPRRHCPCIAHGIAHGITPRHPACRRGSASLQGKHSRSQLSDDTHAFQHNLLSNPCSLNKLQSHLLT